MIKRRRLRRSLTARPLQASKLIGICLGLLLGVAGFLRLISAERIIDNPLLADGQFLALVFVPLVGLALVGIVVLETVVTGYRVLRSPEPIRTQVTGRGGYVLLRAVEASVAVGGLVVMVLLGSTLVAESTPAPVGVGLMLALLAVGIAVLGASLVRSVAELYLVAV